MLGATIRAASSFCADRSPEKSADVIARAEALAPVSSRRFLAAELFGPRKVQSSAGDGFRIAFRRTKKEQRVELEIWFRGLFRAECGRADLV